MSGNGYARSEWTPLKVEHHEAIVSMHLGVVAAVLKRHEWADGTYRYFDLTAGPGRGPDGEPQSPLQFVRAAARAGIDWRAVFVERSPETYRRLNESLPTSWPCVRVVQGDSRDLLTGLLVQELPRARPNYYGLVYFDPVPGVEMFEVIGRLGEAFRSLRQLARVDVLMYVSATTIKRLRECCGQTLRGLLAGLGKRHWFARDTYDSRHQWTFLLGTNWPDMKEYGRIRLFSIDREPGATLFDRLDLTDAERKEKAVAVLPFPEPA